MKILALVIVCFICSCALPIKRGEEHSKPLTQVERILECVERFRGEGFKKAYEVCRDLHTLE